jgi:hypothetical protein
MVATTAGSVKAAAVREPENAEWRPEGRHSISFKVGLSPLLLPAIAAATAAAATATATATAAALLGDIDPNGATVQLGAVDLFDRRLGRGRRVHGDESKAA